MSFSYDTKKELTEIVPEINSLSLAQCYGMLLFAKRFTYNELVFTTENKYVCDNLSNLLTILYTPMIEKTSGLRVRNSKNPLITVKLPNEDDCNRIFESFGYSKKDVSLRLNRANISEEGQIPAFLRGVLVVNSTPVVFVNPNILKLLFSRLIAIFATVQIAYPPNTNNKGLYFLLLLTGITTLNL